MTAEQIGKVDLRDSHTIVDVASDVAEKVIAALNGSTIAGVTCWRARIVAPPRAASASSARRSAGATRGASAVVRRAARLRAAEGFAVTSWRSWPPRGGERGGLPRRQRSWRPGRPR